MWSVVRARPALKATSAQGDIASSQKTLATTTAPVLRCGDGLVQRWEDCDDGNDINTDSCLTGCARCAAATVCARHLTIHDPEYEACDDGNLDDDGCTSECRLARLR